MADVSLADIVAEVQTRLGDPDGERYPVEMVQLMVNSGLQFLFPKFYVIEPMTLSADGSQKFFELTPTTGEEVGGVLDVYETEA